MIVHEIRNTRHERKRKEKGLEEKGGENLMIWFEMIPRREIIQPDMRTTRHTCVSNKDGVKNPPTFILFRILFEIRLCSFVERRGAEPPRGVCMCYGHDHNECHAT